VYAVANKLRIHMHDNNKTCVQCGASISPPTFLAPYSSADNMLRPRGACVVMLLILICVCVGVFQPGQLQQHAFKSKALKRAKPCHLCHQPVLLQASCCRGKTKNMFVAFSLSLCGARTKITTWGEDEIMVYQHAS
jgi:hypothetical protein